MKAELIAVGTELLLGQIVDTNSRTSPPDCRRWASTSSGCRRSATTWSVRERRWSALAALRRHLHDRRPRPDRGRPDARGHRRDAGRGDERRAGPGDGACAPSSPAATVRCPSATSSRPRSSHRRGPSPTPTARRPAGGWSATGRVIIAMPGPPGEMRRMWESEVEPELRRRSSGIVLVSRTLKTSDVTEGARRRAAGRPQARREPDRQRLLARRRHPGAHRRQGRRPARRGSA